MVRVLKPAVLHSAAVELRIAERFALSDPVIQIRSPANTFSMQFQFQNENCLQKHRFSSPAKEKNLFPSPFYLGIELLKITFFHSSLPIKARRVYFQIYNLTIE